MDWNQLISLWLTMSFVATILMAEGILTVKETSAKYRLLRIPLMAIIIILAPITLPLIIVFTVINAFRGSATIRIW